ncbi:MAG: alpha/beta hydrolase [Candidatus Eremiobacteraeota bacterium]|nr:alpha/beta hydrolase [Candidatus Eremiobacteraeota bacterium]
MFANGKRLRSIPLTALPRKPGYSGSYVKCKPRVARNFSGTIVKRSNTTAFLGAIASALAFAVAFPLHADGKASPQPKETRPPGLTSGKLANREFLVISSRGDGVALYFGNGSLDGNRDATQAIIIVHGVLRNADTYFSTGALMLAKAEASKTLLIAPQFTEASDLYGRHGSSKILRWDGNWPGGVSATAPAPISTYAVFDAMLTRLADRSRFPALRRISIIGHSAGGQIVQRYAAVGHGPALIPRAALTVHFVVANPSSYLYFDTWRPHKMKACSDFNRWRYGLDGTPSYVTGTARELEQRYVHRDVTYLLGTADINAQEWDLDTSCAAEEQGAYRLQRGRAYIRYLRTRNPKGTAQDFALVPGVGHDNRKMFTSACGLAVVFDRPRSACAASGNI